MILNKLAEDDFTKIVYALFYPGTFWGKLSPNIETSLHEFSATPAMKLKIMSILD